MRILGYRISVLQPRYTFRHASPRTGVVTALDLRARIHPAHNPHVTPVAEVLSPSFRTYVGDFGSAAATKCVSRCDDGALFKWKKNAGKTP